MTYLSTLKALAILMLFVVETGSISCRLQRHKVSAFLGETAHLSCPFTVPAEEQRGFVSWQKTETGGEVVVHYQNGEQNDNVQSRAYTGRTRLRGEWLSEGNAQLELQKVQGGDAGEYSCWVTLLPVRAGSQRQCSKVTLNVTEGHPQQETGERSYAENGFPINSSFPQRSAISGAPPPLLLSAPFRFQLS
ncbi:CD276 antigen-like [Bombina bombina]|uniref:CD276 antigen-like n=1 Tax=Bombina bombina TaxID=8345 RepID=UPI00235A669B|nr:CD276 antigen-like [Bombina bombina]